MRLILPLIFFVFLLEPGAAGEEESFPKELPDYLVEMSLEDLMNIEVTSVAKKAKRLSETAAAIYVINHEDIRRSGAKRLPDLLRMVPGLHVAQIDSNTWSVSSRGFAGQSAGKLLVLIDGRSVYTPLFSGVFWSLQDVMLEDVERIEIIRGPGASVWGANAVNGVINIITQNARDTQGGRLTTGAGNEERGFGGVRYGDQLSEHMWYRVYAKYADRDDSILDGRSGGANDGWDHLQGGFRIDWDATDDDSFTFQGDVYDQQSGRWKKTFSLTPPYESEQSYDSDSRGGNFLARWRRSLAAGRSMFFQVYYDRVATDQLYDFSQKYDTIDLDFQHQIALGERHELIWGLGYRFMKIDGNNFDAVALSPETRDDSLVSAFIQDEINIVDDLLELTVGTKVERNDYTGLEVQPTARLLWKVHEYHTAWASVSRAVSTPSLGKIDTRILANTKGPTPPLVPFPIETAFVGNDDLEPEEILAFEAGYRAQISQKLSLDLATFYNVYDNLFNLEFGTTTFVPTPLPHFYLPVAADNKMDGETYGAELAADWWAEDWWQMRAAYSFLSIHLDIDGNSLDTISERSEGWSPQNQFSLRSYFDLTENLELDAGVRYVDRLSELDIGSYTGFDLRLGWRPLDDLEISIVGQNLLQRRHAEFVPDFGNTSSTEVEQSVYLQLSWRF